MANKTASSFLPSTPEVRQHGFWSGGSINCGSYPIQHANMLPGFWVKQLGGTPPQSYNESLRCSAFMVSTVRTIQVDLVLRWSVFCFALRPTSSQEGTPRRKYVQLVKQSSFHMGVSCWVPYFTSRFKGNKRKPHFYILGPPISTHTLFAKTCENRCFRSAKLPRGGCPFKGVSSALPGIQLLTHKIIMPVS